MADETFSKVKKIIVEQLGVEDDQVEPAASFVDDLNANSLDLVELIMSLEEEFGMDLGRGRGEDPDRARRRRLHSRTSAVNRVHHRVYCFQNRQGCTLSRIILSIGVSWHPWSSGRGDIFESLWLVSRRIAFDRAGRDDRPGRKSSQRLRPLRASGFASSAGQPRSSRRSSRTRIRSPRSRRRWRSTTCYRRRSSRWRRTPGPDAGCSPGFRNPATVVAPVFRNRPFRKRSRATTFLELRTIRGWSRNGSSEPPSARKSCLRCPDRFSADDEWLHGVPVVVERPAPASDETILNQILSTAAEVDATDIGDGGDGHERARQRGDTGRA